jgi:hypothetical protein
MQHSAGGIEVVSVAQLVYSAVQTQVGSGATVMGTAFDCIPPTAMLISPLFKWAMVFLLSINFLENFLVFMFILHFCMI